jgi:hypothetical protein
MASIIQIKRGTGSAVPSGLADGELAINLDNNKLYFGTGSAVKNDFHFNTITASDAISSSFVGAHQLGPVKIQNGGINLDTDGTSYPLSSADGILSIGHPSATSGTKFENPITASGNISASGDLYSYNITVGRDINVDRAITCTSLSNVFSTTHVTSSGNISASGTLIGGALIATSTNTSEDAAHYITFQKNGHNLHNTTNGLSFNPSTDQLTLGGNINIKGQDSEITGLSTITGAVTFSSHITASGNISASSITATGGNIIGNKLYDIDQEYSGDVVSFGTGPGGVNGDIVQGELYCLDSSQHWEKADADTLATSAGMLGIAIADDDPTFLVKGIIGNTAFAGFTTGQVLYVHTTPGDVTNTAPSDNTEVVRVVGYAIDGGNRIIYFDPDKTWVQVTA